MYLFRTFVNECEDILIKLQCHVLIMLRKRNSRREAEDFPGAGILETFRVCTFVLCQKASLWCDFIYHSFMHYLQFLFPNFYLFSLVAQVVYYLQFSPSFQFFLFFFPKLGADHTLSNIVSIQLFSFPNPLDHLDFQLT